jgi:hypothetical protein
LSWQPQENPMTSYVGPNGRLYRRASHPGRWIAATIVCLAVIAVAIVGLPNIAQAFRLLGF